MQPQSRPERPRSSGSWTANPNPLAPRCNEKSKRYGGCSQAIETRILGESLHQVHRTPARTKIRKPGKSDWPFKRESLRAEWGCSSMPAFLCCRCPNCSARIVLEKIPNDELNSV